MEIKRLIDKETKLEEYTGDDRMITAYEMLKELDNEKVPDVLLKSMIPSLDKSIGGFEGGELTTISGLTGNGKTLFCQTLTNNFFQQRFNSAWFSYEVQPRHFLKKFGSELPPFVMPRMLKGNSLDWLEERIWEAVIKHDIKAVFIDHLHFLINMNSRQNMSLEIGSVMRRLKSIALQHNLAIFIVCHTTKTKITDDDGLDLSDIRDSSFTSQEADNVLLIWRANDIHNGALLKIAKDRKNGTFNKIIGLVKGECFLREVEHV
jgi:replicative DNA helicase